MKLVILDRDGVINQDSEDFVKSADEWLPLPGSIEAITHLHSNGFTVVVATNQSGLALGKFDLDDLEAMHRKFSELVEVAGGEVAAIFYCPHGDDDRCNCRKPKPGLIDAIEAEFDISAQGVPLVGDSLGDLQAGIAKGCQPILVKSGSGLTTLEKLSHQTEPGLDDLLVFDDLRAAADHLVKSVSGDNC